jgi:hypothetical protein
MHSKKQGVPLRSALDWEKVDELICRRLHELPIVLVA